MVIIVIVIINSDWGTIQGEITCAISDKSEMRGQFEIMSMISP